MAQQKSLTKNFILNVLLRVASILFPLISFPYVSRVLQPAGIGKVSFAMSVANYFLILAQLGIPTYGIHACAKVRDDKEKLSRIVQELFLLSMLTTVLAYIALAVTVALVPQFYEAKGLIAIMSVSILLKTLGMEWLYRALEQYEYITTRAMFAQLIAIAAMFLLIKGKGDYAVYGAVMVFAGQASCLFNFFHARKFIHIQPVGNYRFRCHIKGVMVLFAMTCVVMIYTNLDTVMLGILCSDAEVGYYNVAVNVKTVLANTIATVGTVLLPRTSWYYEKGMIEPFYHTSKKAIHAIIIMAVPLALYFMVFASECVEVLSGKGFADAVVPMQIIMPALFAIGVTNIIGIQILVPMGKEKYTLYSVVAGAAADLILNALFIPKYGASGAAFGTLAAEFIVFAIQYICLRRLGRKDGQQTAFGIDFLEKEAGQNQKRKRKIKTTQSSYCKIALASGLGCLASFALKKTSFSAFWLLAVSAVVFFGLYAGLLWWWKEPLVREAADRFLRICKKENK